MSDDYRAERAMLAHLKQTIAEAEAKHPQPVRPSARGGTLCSREHSDRPCPRRSPGSTSDVLVSAAFSPTSALRCIGGYFRGLLPPRGRRARPPGSSTVVRI